MAKIILNMAVTLDGFIAAPMAVWSGASPIRITVFLNLKTPLEPF